MGSSEDIAGRRRRSRNCIAGEQVQLIFKWATGQDHHLPPAPGRLCSSSKCYLYRQEKKRRNRKRRRRKKIKRRREKKKRNKIPHSLEDRP